MDTTNFILKMKDEKWKMRTFILVVSFLFSSSLAQNSNIKWSSFSTGFVKSVSASTNTLSSTGETFAGNSGNGSSKITSGFLAYKIIADTVSIEIPNLPFAAGTGSAIVWNNSLYYFGGSSNWSGTTLYPFIYKFDGVSWGLYDTIPDNNVFSFAATLVGDEVYLNGGDRANAATLNRKYNMISKEWDYLTPSPNLQYGFGLTSEVYDGKIYLFNNGGDVFVYDISGDTWETKTKNTGSGIYPNIRSILYNNDIYLTGWGNYGFYKYSPSTDQWTQLANTPYQVYACSMGIIDNLIYCIGGNDGFNYATYKSAMIYNVNDNSWTIDTVAISSYRDWMASAEYEGSFYVLGGLGTEGSGNAVDIVERIIPYGTVNVEDEPEAIPNVYKLNQNYPNPFNPSTIINFQVPEESFVTLKIYDILGSEVKTLVNENKLVGSYNIHFDATGLASGIYFYKLNVNRFSETKKMILMK